VKKLPGDGTLGFEKKLYNAPLSISKLGTWHEELLHLQAKSIDPSEEIISNIKTEYFVSVDDLPSVMARLFAIREQFLHSLQTCIVREIHTDDIIRSPCNSKYFHEAASCFSICFIWLT
jgi:hypothetical protein